MPTEEQTYRASIQEKLDTILEQVKYTNGKVRKIVIALAVLGGIVVGQLFTPKEITSIFTSFFL